MYQSYQRYMIFQIPTTTVNHPLKSVQQSIKEAARKNFALCLPHTSIHLNMKVTSEMAYIVRGLNKIPHGDEEYSKKRENDKKIDAANVE